MERFWLARGPCAECGTLSARRVEKAGRYMVVCNKCRAMTEHDAVLMERPGRGRPPTAAALDAMHDLGRGGFGGVSRRFVIVTALLVVLAGGCVAIWWMLR